jgi:hypothetical protein
VLCEKKSWLLQGEEEIKQSQNQRRRHHRQVGKKAAVDLQKQVRIPVLHQQKSSKVRMEEREGGEKTLHWKSEGGMKWMWSRGKMDG